MKTKAERVRCYVRWTLNQRIQHMALIISFTTLVVTGLPIRYHEAGLAEAAVRVMGGMTMRGYIHRGAAVVLILLAIYHIGYVIFSHRGRREILAIMPGIKDLKDSIGMVLFYTGIAKQKPLFDRYNFIEKFEYLALAWGSVVMIVTGAMLWFEEQTMIIVPKWAVDVAQIVHSYEALLAFLAILIWHLYHVHLNPEVFPMSRIWLTGKITEQELKEHHPLEYERIKAKRNPEGEDVT